MTEIVRDIPPPPPRPAEAHKGTFGTVIVIGGSENMIGAPALAATAALRAGCGLAKVMTWPGLIPHVLSIEPCATAIPVPYLDDPGAVERILAGLSGRTVLAVGPGMSTGEVARRGVETVLRHELPIVLDADGLNNLAMLGDRIARPACPRSESGAGPLVLTPHPGEYRRLAEAAGIKLDPTDPDQRPAAAAAMAERYGAIVVLKGRHTIISDGQRHAVNRSGNPALATAGSGDILTGVIASLIAQSLEPFDAAVLGAHLHGLAADLWVERHDGSPAGMLARDLANWVPHAIAAQRAAAGGGPQ